MLSDDSAYADIVMTSSEHTECAIYSQH